MSDDVRRIGLRPDSHRDTTSGIWLLYLTSQRSQFYKLQVVGTRKQDASRKMSDPETCWYASMTGMSDDGSGEDVSA